LFFEQNILKNSKNKKMKNLFSFLLLITGMVVLNACTKSGTDGVKQPEPVSSVPNVSLLKSADSILYNSMLTINWRSNKPVTIAGITGTEGSYQVGPFTANTTVNVVASYDGDKTVTTQVNLVVWSPKRSQYEALGQRYMTYYKSCIAGTENDPNAIWIPGPLNTNFWFRIFANGKSLSSLGSGVWTPVNENEDLVVFEGLEPSNPWKITIYADGTGWERTQTKNGSFCRQIFR
jgi:hypothetical protein